MVKKKRFVSPDVTSLVAVGVAEECRGLGDDARRKRNWRLKQLQKMAIAEAAERDRRQKPRILSFRRTRHWRARWPRWFESWLSRRRALDASSKEEKKRTKNKSGKNVSSEPEDAKEKKTPLGRRTMRQSRTGMRARSG